MLLTKTPKEIFALEKGKFKTPPPMTTPIEKRNHAKFCEFHGKNIGKEQPRAAKKGETSGKDKALTILMVQPWERVARQKITQSFSPNPEIFFPPLGEDEGTKGPIIIEAEIGGHCIHRMYVDGGSASEILYEHYFSRLHPKIKNQLVLATTPLIGFSGEIIWPIRQIQLLVTIGDKEHSASTLMNFVVVRSPSPYNEIIGRSGVRKLQAVPSTVHRMLKIPVEGGVITLKSSRLVPLECAMVSRPERILPADKPMVEKRIKVAINPDYPEQTVMIGSTLTEEEHRLNMQKGCSSIRKKKKGQAADRNQAIQEEVGKLVEAGIMRDVHYHDWLSNPVMIKKHDDSWRMCVDFKDLNKACPKDGYPLPEIDWKVESLCGFSFKCFLDTYKGYHQIQMAKEDEEKIAFITSQGIFCYAKMPFGLRNARATYQRLVDKAFHKQIGRNLEVYVDDLVIKSCTTDEIVKDMEETFKTLREINMKLNPKKSEEAFKQIKQFIIELSMLVAAIKKEELIVYLAAAKETHKLIVDDQNRTPPDYSDWKRQKKHSKHGVCYTNRSSAQDSSRAGLILTNPEGMEFTYALRFRTYVEKETNMIRYLEKVKTLTNSFKAFSIKQVPRSENKKADALSKIASISFAHLSKQVLVEELKEKSISAMEVLAVVEEEGDTWITPIFKYLMGGTLPAEVKKARASETQVVAVLHNKWDTLQKIFLWTMATVRRTTLSQLCSKRDTRGILQHARSIMAKALRFDYYRPTMHEDARMLIRACQDCQVHKPVPRNLQQKLSPITSLWLFYKWGIDIVGPFPEGPVKVKFLIVSINYFTKWIKAKPVATITGN
ncbi:reverse transcriptase domain-containing protein [Tanacetum coccineum]